MKERGRKKRGTCFECGKRTTHRETLLKSDVPHERVIVKNLTNDDFHIKFVCCSCADDLERI